MIETDPVRRISLDSVIKRLETIPQTSETRAIEESDPLLPLSTPDNTVLYYPFIEWPAGQVRVCYHKRKTRYIVHFPLQQLQHKKTAIKTGIQFQQFC